ncbi:hypothetical protein DIURU_001769 [Diutina rugosa]|uniref:Coronin n=1 Tax=Diutina rugosa TaxID=5481 RepID=A0A642UT26_DIURU|nr:uncharacterized protein DIURU_001769 [Diutina rugosa]KAA8904933.1 hypothetical protein DIURU_001769 [Diutina rugosa]
MSGKFVRASKYRHVFGQSTKKELCYENLKITKNAWDSNIIQANNDYLSVNWDASGGGAFAVIPVKEVGKAPDTVPLFRGHKAPVTDTAFNPFNRRQIASCADDGKICVWEIPEDYSFHRYLDDNDEIKDITEPLKVLSGHTRKVGHIQYHPCAENVLASSSLDYTVKIWNVETGKAEITLKHKDLVTSFAFNYNGSLLATTSRDKKLRIWDIRKGEVISEGPSHTGAKPSRVIWLGNTDRVLTTGFDRLSDRQIGLWDINAIDKGPINGFQIIDASSGVLIPFFDESCSILYLAGKGDGNIRYYEYDNDVLHEISQYASTDPQRGFAVAPKNAVNVKECEVVKSYKTVKDSAIEPISFIVPRKSELFQEDIYPDCPSEKPACGADDWFSGKEINGPVLMNMEALFEGEEPELRDSDPMVKVSEKKAEAEKKAEEKKAASAPQSPVKKEEPKKEADAKAKDLPEPNPTVPNSGMPKLTNAELDDSLQSSEKVNSMLKKVEDNSDDEVEDNDGWEEIPKSTKNVAANGEAKKADVSAAKEEPKKEEPKKKEVAKKDIPVKEEPKEEPKQEESKKVTPTEEPKVEATKSESKVEAKETKDEAKAIEKEDTKESTKAATDSVDAKPEAEKSKTSSAPTLKQTVEKLAQIAVNLEQQIEKMAQAQLEKDDRLAALEARIEQLMKGN